MNWQKKHSVRGKIAKLKMCRYSIGVSVPGITGSSGGAIDSANPTTKEQFSELKNNLLSKLQSLSAKENYNEFMEELIRDLCVGCEFTTGQIH